MRISTLFAAFILLGLSTGCANQPVLGEWESERRLSNGEKNQLELLEDFTGDAEIWATPTSDPNAWFRFEFDVEWWDDGGGVYGFDLDCTEGPCNSDNFDMECELIEVESDDGAPLQKLDCEGDRKWENYPLQWQRD